MPPLLCLQAASTQGLCSCHECRQLPTASRYRRGKGSEEGAKRLPRSVPVRGTQKNNATGALTATAAAPRARAARPFLSLPFPSRRKRGAVRMEERRYRSASGAPLALRCRQHSASCRELAVRCPRLQLRSLSAVTSAVWLAAYGLFVLCQVPPPRPAPLGSSRGPRRRRAAGAARRALRVAALGSRRAPAGPCRSGAEQIRAVRGSGRAGLCPAGAARRTAAAALWFSQWSFPWNDGREGGGSQLAVVRYVVATARCCATCFTHARAARMWLQSFLSDNKPDMNARLH